MKDLIRKKYKKLRQDIIEQEAAEKSQIIREKLFALPFWENAKTIMCYLSFKNEVNTKMIIERAWQQKKQVIIPVCKANSFEIIPSILNSFDDLEPRTMGILEPKEGKLIKADPLTIDLCIIPGVAFDPWGHRVGFGAGYYDRFLPLLKKDTPKIALSYQLQISPEPLPSDGYDVLMDYILTENNFYQINR
ncbi:MAG: 5-formyltetrahydrofolate cyclo-ligase [Bacillota bacterium]